MHNKKENMNKYNPNIHHRSSIRLKGYDYSQAGLYFITICCQHRACLFGEITYGEMILNDTGKIANQCWLEIPNHFSNTLLHEHIIMPNHIHGIVELVGAKNFSPEIIQPMPPIIPTPEIANPMPENTWNTNGAKDSWNTNGAKNSWNTIGAKDSWNTIGAKDSWNTNGAKDFSPLRSPSKTIGSVVRGFKIGVTKWIRQNTDIYDIWQRNYYEHIIRNDQSYQTISDYIVNNPKKWNDDKFYKL